MRADVTVIGAGPSGLIAAREVAEKGFDVKVVEEDPEVGVPNHCAGLLSLSGMKEIGVPTDETFVENYVKGAVFYSPSGLSFTVEKSRYVACVVDRELFDKYLAQKACEAGVDILVKTKAKGVLFPSDREVAVKTTADTINSAFVIDAEGVNSRILKSLSLKPIEEKYVLKGLQFDLEGVEVDEEFVEVHLNRKLAPGLFCWVIPTGEDRARVGLAGRNIDARRNLEFFVKRRFKAYTIERVRGGLVVTSGPIPVAHTRNLAVIGDAAGQVKPTTGGGVILGGICASICGRVLAEALEREELGSKPLLRYERLWREKLTSEFRVMKAVRRLANKLPDKLVDYFFKLIIDQGLDRTLSEKGDMDFQREALSTLLKAMPKPLNMFIKRYL